MNIKAVNYCKHSTESYLSWLAILSNHVLSSSGQASPLDTGDHEGWPQAPPWENRPDCAPTMARNPTLSLLIISEKYWNCPWFIPTKTHGETGNCCPNNPRNPLLSLPPPPPLYQQVGDHELVVSVDLLAWFVSELDSSQWWENVACLDENLLRVACEAPLLARITRLPGTRLSRPGAGAESPRQTPAPARDLTQAGSEPPLSVTLSLARDIGLFYRLFVLYFMYSFPCQFCKPGKSELS